MPFNEALTADKVEPQVRQHQRAMNAARFAPPLPRLAAEASAKHKLYIFNVGPWPQVRLLGSAGQFFIQACEPGKPYSAPLMVPGIVREHYPDSEVSMKPLDDDGEWVASQIIGADINSGGPIQGCPPRESFVQYGVFVDHSETPSKDKVARAKAALLETCRQIYLEADAAQARGPKAVEEIIRPETHFVAARLLGHNEKDTVWMKNAAVPGETQDCPGCGTTVKVGIIVCPSCKFILEKELYKAADYAK